MSSAKTNNLTLISLLAKKSSNLVFKNLLREKTSSLDVDNTDCSDLINQFVHDLKDLKKMDLELNLAELSTILCATESNIKRLLNDLSIRPVHGRGFTYRLNDILNRLFKVNIGLSSNRQGFTYKKKTLREIDLNCILNK